MTILGWIFGIIAAAVLLYFLFFGDDGSNDPHYF